VNNIKWSKSSSSYRNYKAPTDGTAELIAMGPEVTQATTENILQKGEVNITSESSSRKNSKERNSPQYMWDEPWNGGNAPRQINKPRDEDTIESVMRPTHTKATITNIPRSESTETNTRSLNTARISTATTVSESQRKSAGSPSIIVVEQDGYGILPAPSTATSNMSSVCSRDDHDIDLPIQGIPNAITVPPSHLAPARISSQTRSTSPLPLEFHSWLDFEFGFPTEEVRPKTSDAVPDRKRLSWLDDRSRESLYEGRRLSMGVSLRPLYGIASDASEDIGREKIRVLGVGQRGEELGWDPVSSESSDGERGRASCE